MAAVELATVVEGGGGREVRGRHVPAVFRCCYFYLHTAYVFLLHAVCASSFKDSDAAAIIIIIVIIIIVVVVINNVCAAYIVDINGTIRRPASLHKRKCRVVSVSQAEAEAGGEQQAGYISDRRTNDHNCNG